jgi:hypothetical protein
LLSHFNYVGFVNVKTKARKASLRTFKFLAYIRTVCKPKLEQRLPAEAVASETPQAGPVCPAAIATAAPAAPTVRAIPAGLTGAPPPTAQFAFAEA